MWGLERLAGPAWMIRVLDHVTRALRINKRPVYLATMTIDENLDGTFEGFHLAQVNIGIAAHPLEAPEMADFMQNLDRVNKLGSEAPGYVWHLVGEDGFGGATDVVWPGDPAMIVNLTVWESVRALRAFVFAGDHVSFLRRRREFFVPQAEAIAVLWWIPAGTIPAVAEAKARLDRLREHGPTAHAFTFQRTYAPVAEG